MSRKAVGIEIRMYSCQWRLILIKRFLAGERDATLARCAIERSISATGNSFPGEANYAGLPCDRHDISICWMARRRRGWNTEPLSIVCRATLLLQNEPVKPRSLTPWDIRASPASRGLSLVPRLRYTLYDGHPSMLLAPLKTNRVHLCVVALTSRHLAGQVCYPAGGSAPRDSSFG